MSGPDPSPVPPGWAEILEPGERVLWQGRPSRRLRIGRVDMARTGMGLVFVVFSIFWMAQAASIGARTDSAIARLLPLFGLIFLGLGIYNAGGHLVWRGFRHRFTTYTLTNRRAFIATNLPLQSRRLAAHPLDPDTPLELVDGAPGSVWFGHRFDTTANGGIRTPIGFDNIDNPRSVYAELLRVQKALT